MSAIPVRSAFVTRQVLGIPIAAVRMSDMLDIVHEAIRGPEALSIGVVNAAKIVNMNREPSLRAAVLESDMIVADGMSVVWASRILGAPLPERVAGIDLMMGMLERGGRHGYRVYLLGATREVVTEVARRIGRDYPGVDVVGFRDGYFGEHEEEAVAAEIASARADILLVAITSPKKERFLAAWGPRLGVPVCHGVGGSFDVYSGKTRRAPHAWRRGGFEWLYRLLQEPRRMWKRYLYTNSVFIWLVVRHRVAGRGDAVGNGAGARE